MSSEKVRENRLRRMAERQGFALHKSRRRDPRALDYGHWLMVDTTDRGRTVAGDQAGSMTLDDVEAFLTREAD